MSLVACRHCGKQAASEAKACPHCGGDYPDINTFNAVQKNDKFTAVFLLCLGLGILAMFVKIFIELKKAGL